MGLRGPSSKAASLRLLEGSARVGVTTSEPAGVAKCPDWIDEHAQRVWHRVVEAFPPRYFTAADEDLLVAYCVCCAQLRHSTMMLATDGYTDTSSQGNRVASVWVRMNNQAKAALPGLAAKLGIGPAVRGDHASPHNTRSKGAKKARHLYGDAPTK